jgi:hypothetical protein
MTRLSKLRRLAGAATVENDRQAGCYRARAPHGMRWDEGPHELVSWYDLDPSFAAEARDHLAERLQDTRLEACIDPDCDWCNGY